MTYQIIKNASLKTGKDNFPLGQMQINDAFDIDAGMHAKLESAANYYRKKHGTKFTIRKHGDGYRCQRVA